MSPRVKPSGAWAKSGRYVNAVDSRTGAVEEHFTWRGVPLGTIDTVDVEITPAWDDLGRLVIRGIYLSKPITAARLKALPLDALRREAMRLWHRHCESGLATVNEMLKEQGIPVPETTGVDRLSALAVTDRSSDAFLAAVAAAVREARAQGRSGWAAVSEATGVQRIQAQRYMAKARDAGHDLGTLRRTSDTIVATDSTTTKRKGRKS